MLSNASVKSIESSDVKTIDLAAPGVAKLLAERIRYDIDDYAIKSFYEPHRSHLGASVIGHECSRYLWYNFRWCKADDGKGEAPADKHENHARMQRLFNRGHLEEHRYIDYLKGIGFQVFDKDPATGKQFLINACSGHFGGSGDGVLIAPPRYNLPKPLLAEFKTIGTGRKFVELRKDGVNKSKQQHYTQMSVYGTHLELDFAAYFNTNKNDDDMHVEIVPINKNLGRNMIYKAEKIITATEPPQKLALDPEFFQCKYCVFKGICHDKEKPETNCRSCRYAKPVQDSEWLCTKFDNIIPKDFIPKGCEAYNAIQT